MTQNSAIAIVGMACRFAGADSLQEYWRMCVEGRDGFSSVPADRWDADAFYSENKRSFDKSYAPRGGFIEDVRSFPAVELQIPPRRVEVMDPQQRMTIEQGLLAIEDAGCGIGDMPRRTGVFVGVTATEWKTLMSSRITAQLMASGDFGDAPEDTEALARAVSRVVPPRAFTAPGALANMAACSVAQELKLAGPAYTVDAACSSALIAVHDAVAQLRAGLIDAALAGGVYICLTPEHHIAFSRIGAMSASGYCRPFDARADGFVQGDGCGMLVLKRLDDALAHGDRIYATIRGIAANNDAGEAGPMAPVQASQTAVIREAWQGSGCDPAQLGYVEAHGTGTLAGDKAEFDGLVAAIGVQVRDAALGSSKANIGHTMSAAGVAGVIRAALALHHQTVPPMASFEHAKSDLGIDASGFRIPTAATPWTETERLASVSAFGFGGTNVHVVLSCAPGLESTQQPADQAELVLISGPDEPGLRALAAATADAIESDAAITVAAVARAWSTRRPLRWRLGVVAESREQLIERLRAVAEERRCDGVELHEAKRSPKVAFLYPGQGAQRTGMIAGIRDRFPVVADTIAKLEAAADGRTRLPLSHYLYPERRAQSVSDDEATAEITATENCQPVLYAVAVALTRLLSQVGVRPAMAAGHSVGEFAAAAAVSLVSDEDGQRFVCARGRAMGDMQGDRGAMLAIRGGVDVAEPLLVDGAIIANVNHPMQVVISGRTEAIDRVQARAEAADVRAVRLGVSHGFHSEVFDGLDLSDAVDAVSFRRADAPVISCITGEAYDNAERGRDIFNRHATSPVDFVQTLNACSDEGADIFLQVSAGGPVLTFAKRTLKGRSDDIVSLATNRDDDGGASLLQGLAALWTRGVDMDLRAITAASAPASLPPSRLPREAYWCIRAGQGVAAEISGASSDRHSGTSLGGGGESPVEAPTSAAPEGDGRVEAAVYGAVSRASAYPLDSLRGDMRLIEDLGFDSMMTADLVEELTRTIDGVTAIPRELLMRSPTLQDMVDFCESPGETTDPSADHEPLLRYVPDWHRSELTAPGSLLHGDSHVWIAGPNDMLASVVSTTLQSLGATTERVAGDATLNKSASLVVWCETDDMPAPVATIAGGDDGRLHDARALIDVLARAKNAGSEPSLIVCANIDDVWAEGCGGVARAMSKEWPDACARFLRFERGLSARDRAQIVANECSRDDRSTDVLYRDGLRYVASQQLREDLAPWAAAADDCVLITGGTRGIGLKLARRLAPSGATLLLLSRSEAEGECAEWIANTPTVHHVRADVTDPGALRSGLAGYPAVTTLVHAAGVLADGPVESSDAERGRLARETKARGWACALEACGQSLKRALVVGSWAGRFGNRHQSHYASANALVSALTTAAPDGVQAACAEYGPWIDSEMAATIPTAIRAAMRNDGVDFVGDEAGIDALLRDLSAGGASIRGRRIPSSGRRKTTHQRLAVDTHPFLADHAIGDVPVFPLASAADLCAHAAGVATPFELASLELFDGIRVTRPVEVTAEATNDRVELSSEGVVRYRARVPAAPGDLNIEDRLIGGEAPSMSLDTFYSDVTFHGPLLAGIVSIDGIGDDFVRGRIRTSKPVDWIPGSHRSAWSIDPLALDSAFQLAAYVAWNRYQRAGTPVSLDRYVQLKPMPEGEVYADVRFGERDDDRFRADITLRDEQGDVVAAVRGVTAVLSVVEDASDNGETAVSKADAAPDPGTQYTPPAEHVDPDEWPEVRDIQMKTMAVKAFGLKDPYFDLHDGTARDTSLVGGREVINFSSYNYLGYSGDSRVIADVEKAIHQFGTSVSASRVASGERPFHRNLEAALAKANDCDDAIVFSGGHATNVNVIGHLFGPKDLILHDELVHDSCLQGIKLSGAARRGFRHDDVEHLESQLRELRPHYEKVLIVIEGVYSMDGDISNIPGYVALRAKYGALLMIDEAHSFGTVGATGLGVREHFGLRGCDADIWMGTMSKSLASMGGWVSGKASLIKYLRYSAPGFVFAAGIPPALGQAALSSLELMLQEPERVVTLQHNCAYFFKELSSHGINTGPALGESPVVPVITGDSMKALKLSEILLDRGINAKPIIYPAVAEDAARLRFFLSSTHSEEQLKHTAAMIAQILSELSE